MLPVYAVFRKKELLLFSRYFFSEVVSNLFDFNRNLPELSFNTTQLNGSSHHGCVNM